MNRSQRFSFCYALFSLFFAVNAPWAARAQSALGSYPNLILSESPAAYYRLEEQNGAAIAIDSSSNQFNGDYTFDTGSAGVFPEQGLPGIATNSVLFKVYQDDGAQHFGDISVPFQSILNPAVNPTNASPFSVEFWAQPTTQPADYSVPVSSFGRYVDGDPIYANASGWNFYQSPGPASVWVLNLKPAVFAQATAVPISLFQWYYLAATFDGTNAVFYVNGIAQGTFNAKAFIANPTEPLHIGTGATTGFLPFNGGIDEVAIYTNALSAEKIASHYTLGTNSFRAAPTPPSIVEAPVGMTNFSGTTVKFAVVANGTAPVTYQWFRGSSVIPGETNSALTFTSNFATDNNATFFVAITNLYGGLNSSPVSLNVLTNLNILNQPFSITRRVGSHAAFRVNATGAQPITYQWFKGESPIAGATNDTLWLSNLALADNGSVYHAKMTNPFTSINSDIATLTVEARSNPPITPTGYAKVVLADDPVAYWRLDETDQNGPAIDLAGSFDGAFDTTAGAVSFGIAPGIPNESDSAIGLTGGAIVTIPYALELNPVTGPWSAEAWVKPDSLDPGHFRTVFSSMWNSDFGGHVFGWNVYQHVAGVWTLNIFNGSGSSTFVSDFAHNPLDTNKWYHMVIADDLTTIRFYVNGTEVGSSTAAPSGFVANGINGDVSVAGAPTVLGQRSDKAFDPFDGKIDEVAFYNKALTLQQVQAHFANSVALSLSVAGTNVILTWPFGTLQQSTQVNGTYVDMISATSPAPVPITGKSQFFRIKL